MSRRIAFPMGHAQNAPRPEVRLTRDSQEIVRYLELRRPYSAPVYGYLEPRYLPHTHWYVTDHKGSAGLLLRVDGASSAAIHLQGAPEAAEALLAEAALPRYGFLTFESHLEALARRHFLLREYQALVRMAVTAETFAPVDSSLATPLQGHQISEVNQLYRSDSGARISREQLSEGIYYGIWQDERLVSVAGTQLVSPIQGMAMVANVLTHPQYRNRGYATQCVGALTAHLLERARIHDVTLNVHQENLPAVRAYHRLGYRQACTLGAAWAFWRGRNLFDRIVAHLYDWLT